MVTSPNNDLSVLKRSLRDIALAFDFAAPPHCLSLLTRAAYQHDTTNTSAENKTVTLHR